MRASKQALVAEAVVDMDRIEEVFERVRAQLGEDDYVLMRKLLHSYQYLTDLVEDRGTTIEHLRKILFGATSEKTAKILGDAVDTAKRARSGVRPEPFGTVQGHGRTPAEEYRGATRIAVPHGSLKKGDRCPHCRKGKLYDSAGPKRLLRLFGQAPIQANVYELERLRCNLCGKVHVADAPLGIGKEKYDASSASMIAVLKYGFGMPWNRLEGLQRNAEIPLPASTQWEIVSNAAPSAEPVYEEMIRQAAQGEVLHNDDTGMTVHSLSARIPSRSSTEEGLGPDPPVQESKDQDQEFKADLPESNGKPLRTGVFTSAIVAIQEGRKIALFFTGRQHAGENLSDVLRQRAQSQDPPIQMCDALSRNVPKDYEVILAHCMAHARRRFVDEAPRFPEECRFVLERFREVYRVDAEARERGLSIRERLTLHQERSRPSTDQLKAWCEEQFATRKVEPNSGLGEAIGYLTKHWDRLTRFLSVPGAPLDNNACERALKKAILHRKNAMFYKTTRGSKVGDVFMSLLHTAELAHVNAFHYLTEILRNPEQVKANPAGWMPWNYPNPRDPAQSVQGSCHPPFS